MFVCVCVFCQSKGSYRCKTQSEVIYTILKWKITFPVDGFLISLRPCQKRLETLIHDMQTGALWNENLQLNITECEFFFKKSSSSRTTDEANCLIL